MWFFIKLFLLAYWFCAYGRYHSLHHTEMDSNFCLFMPLFDAMGNTLNAKSWQQHKEISLASGTVSPTKLHQNFWRLKLEAISFIPSFKYQKERLNWLTNNEFCLWFFSFKQGKMGGHQILFSSHMLWIFKLLCTCHLFFELCLHYPAELSPFYSHSGQLLSCICFSCGHAQKLS